MNTLMKSTKEQELLFVVYENLLEANLKRDKTDSVMVRFFISIEEQLKNFEEDYPEIVSEYYFKHRPYRVYRCNFYVEPCYRVLHIFFLSYAKLLFFSQFLLFITASLRSRGKILSMSCQHTITSCRIVVASIVSRLCRTEGFVLPNGLFLLS